MLLANELARIDDELRRAYDGDCWHGRPAKHVWSLWTRYACTAFYSHPSAWTEIGFPGPAYPRLQERRSRQARAVRGPRRAAIRRPRQRGCLTGLRDQEVLPDHRVLRDRRVRRGSVRARNSSAWLLPNDGTRTNHRLRRDMRRLPQLRGTQPVHHRWQRAAHPGQRQPGPDDHGRGRPRRRSPGRRRIRRHFLIRRLRHQPAADFSPSERPGFHRRVVL